MSKQSLIEEIALLDLEHEIPEQRIKKKKTPRHMSDSFRKKCSDRMKRQWADKEWRERQLEHLHSIDHSKGHPMSPEARKKMSLAWTEERRQRQSETLKKTLSKPEIQEKLSNRVKGKHWWHKGPVNTFSYDCPGDGWERGRV